jgi:transcriptional regulator with XRE-family HTH domain
MKPSDFDRYDIIPDVAKRPFSEWLLQQMTARGWGNADLANAARINRQVIWGWLNRNKKPSEENLQAVAKALKIPVEEVYRAAGILPPKEESDEWIERITHQINQLPPEEKELVYRYAEMLREMIEEKDKKRRKS